MQVADPGELLNQDFLDTLFPPDRADEFFDALYGGAEEGAFDIRLAFDSFNPDEGNLTLEFRLTERPGKCMACSLTAGLPPVFRRHPVINLSGIIDGIRQRLAESWEITGWDLGHTSPRAPKLSVIPLRLAVRDSQ